MNHGTFNKHRPALLVRFPVIGRVELLVISVGPGRGESPAPSPCAPCPLQPVDRGRGQKGHPHAPTRPGESDAIRDRAGSGRACLRSADEGN